MGTGGEIMKILFHTNQLNLRGTTTAILDYAKYNQEILGNESIICYDETNPWNESGVYDEIKKTFNVISSPLNTDSVERIIDQEKIDFAYFLRGGWYDFIPTNCKTGVHAVFQHNNPHGDIYAYISEWLSNEMSNNLPWVPHIVDLPTPTKNYRVEWGIHPHQFIFGRHGGMNTFDIDFVKKQISHIVNLRDDFVFVFLGTEKWIDHPNVRFLKGTGDLQIKSNIINTWDAMIHGRVDGESFGLSVAESLFLNKPVLAWELGNDQNHTLMLANSGLLYSEQTLWEKMNNIRELAKKEDWSQRVAQFKPDVVMNKFKEVFLR
jgi:hypothetical protein